MTKLNHIKQLNEFDCGIAVAAMLSGKRYKDADALNPIECSPRGLYDKELADICRELTGLAWRVTRLGFGKNLHRYRLRSVGPCAILIRRRGEKVGHWIAFDGKRVLDPEMPEPTFVSYYPRRSWMIARIILPISEE